MINVNLGEIIKYPINNTRKFLILCVLIILMNLSTILPLYSLNEGILSFMTLIILFIVLGTQLRSLTVKPMEIILFRI